MRINMFAAPALGAALLLPTALAPAALAAPNTSPSPVDVTMTRLDAASAQFSSTGHRVTIDGDLYIEDDDDPFAPDTGRWTSYDKNWPRFHMKRMPLDGTPHKFLDAESRCVDDEVRGEVHATATLAANGWLTVTGVINVFEGTSCGNEIEGSTPFTYGFKPTPEEEVQIASARTDAYDQSHAIVTFRVVNELP